MITMSRRSFRWRVSTRTWVFTTHVIFTRTGSVVALCAHRQSSTVGVLGRSHTERSHKERAIAQTWVWIISIDYLMLRGGQRSRLQYGKNQWEICGIFFWQDPVTSIWFHWKMTYTDANISFVFDVCGLWIWKIFVWHHWELRHHLTA